MNINENNLKFDFSWTTQTVISDFERYIAIMNPIGVKTYWSKWKMIILAITVIIIGLFRSMIKPIMTKV